MTTSLYAALLALLFILLSINVVRCRYKYRVSLGDGGKPPMEQAIRAHGNLAEYGPIFLILLGLSEYQGASGWVIHLLGALFFIGRLSHGWGVAFCGQHGSGNPAGIRYRKAGVLITFLTILTTATLLLVLYGMSAF